jgi:hypothetical protein
MRSKTYIFLLLCGFYIGGRLHAIEVYPDMSYVLNRAPRVLACSSLVGLGTCVGLYPEKARQVFAGIKGGAQAGYAAIKNLLTTTEAVIKNVGGKTRNFASAAGNTLRLPYLCRTSREALAGIKQETIMLFNMMKTIPLALAQKGISAAQNHKLLSALIAGATACGCYRGPQNIRDDLNLIISSFLIAGSNIEVSALNAIAAVKQWSSEMFEQYRDLFKNIGSKAAQQATQKSTEMTAFLQKETSAVIQTMSNAGVSVYKNGLSVGKNIACNVSLGIGQVMRTLCAYYFAQKFIGGCWEALDKDGYKACYEKVKAKQNETDEERLKRITSENAQLFYRMLCHYLPSVLLVLVFDPILSSIFAATDFTQGEYTGVTIIKKLQEMSALDHVAAARQSYADELRSS